MFWREIFEKFEWTSDEDWDYRGDSGDQVWMVDVQENGMTISMRLKFHCPDGIPIINEYTAVYLDGSVINLIPLTAFLAREAKTK